MKLSRRDFLKVSTVSSGAALTGVFSLLPVEVKAEKLRIRYAKQSTTICPYCACGCGMIVSTSKGRAVNIEGDPDHPINEGALCSKGSALYQVANNKRRLTNVMYRAPGSHRWETKSWNWAINRIAQRVKETRDAGLAGTKGYRVDALAGLGGAALDNEECYLYSKMLRAFGAVYIEHQARI
jgi:formate dehydrogenase major subunit